MKRLAGAHADLWAIGCVFALSRFHWVLDQLYHQHPYANQGALAVVVGMLVLVALGYLVTWLAGHARVDPLLRVGLVGMLVFLALIQLRHVFFPSERLSGWDRIGFVALTLALAVVIAWLTRKVWPRFRLALVVVAAVASLSGPAIALLLAKDRALLTQASAKPRPVMILLLDELSAGASGEILASLRNAGLRASAYAVPSIGENTIDVIPALFSGEALPDAITCTPTAVCGSRRVVDFARMKVGRPDVDIVGIYHHYCAIQGLRYCVNPERQEMTEPVWSWFMCSLPVRRLYEPLLDCVRPGELAEHPGDPRRQRGLAEAPFWSQGGVFYVHLRLPHPPGVAGEQRLSEAYAGNVRLAAELVGSLARRLRSGPFGDDFALILTSDHPLRTAFWCQEEPYASAGCNVPAAVRAPQVPFIVAGPGPLTHAEPRSNVDLFTIVEALSSR